MIGLPGSAGFVRKNAVCGDGDGDSDVDTDSDTKSGLSFGFPAKLEKAFTVLLLEHLRAYSKTAEALLDLLVCLWTAFLTNFFHLASFHCK